MSKGKWDVRSRLSAERNKLSLDRYYLRYVYIYIILII